MTERISTIPVGFDWEEWIPRFARGFSVAAAALGLTELLFWGMRFEAFSSPGVPIVPMALSTAISFVALGIVSIEWRGRGERIFNACARGIAAAAGINGLLNCLAFVTGSGLTTDTLLLPSLKSATVLPAGYMSPITGALIFVASLSLLIGLQAVRRGRRVDASAILGSLVFAAGCVVSLGYAHGAPLMYGSHVIPRAATGAAFTLLGAGLVTRAGTESIVLHPFIGSSVYARLLRTFVPLTAAGVLMQAFLSAALGIQSSVNPALVSAFVLVVFVVTASLLVAQASGLVARSIDRVEAERRRTLEELQRTNRALTLLDQCSKVLVHAGHEAELLKDVCWILVESGKYRAVGIELGEKSGGGYVSHASAEYTPSVLMQSGGRDVDGSPAAAVFAFSKVVAVNDVTEHGKFKRWRELAAAHGIKAGISLPLLDSNELLGVLTILSDSGRVFTHEETELLVELAADLAYGIVSLRAKEQQRLAEWALLQSEGKYRHLVEHAPIGIVRTDRGGALLYSNKTGAAIFGFDEPREMIGEQLTGFLVSDTEQRRLLSLARDGETGPVMVETKIRTRAGTLRDVLFNLAHDGGAVTVLVRDVTDMRRLETQLFQIQKMEGIGTLAGGIAHDFNNILGIIVGYAGLLEQQRTRPKKFTRSLDAIFNAADRGKNLVHQLLTFARRGETVRAPNSLNDVVHELNKLLRETFPKTISIILELADALPPVRFDATQMHQVLLNLCVNARDAMPQGGRLTIRTGVAGAEEVREATGDADAESYQMLSVSDTGTGMEESVRRRIFEPFFTTKEYGKGTGLGLSVVFGIVESHGGTLAVESAPGEGTTFRLFFPVESAEPDEPAAAPPAGTEIRGGSETILFIEDEELLRELVRTALEARGYRVITAADGQEGYDVFLRHAASVDAVITDLGLPLVSGDRLLQRMRAVRQELKVLLASGYVETERKAELLRLGARAVIHKPYRVEDVLRHLREVLDAE